MAGNVILDGVKMAELLRSPNGVVGRHLIERATFFQGAARASAPVRSGCLRDTIVKRPIALTDGELEIMVVANSAPCSPTRESYSLMVHDGTDPHVIQAKSGGVLAFNWPGGPTGGMFFARSVNHPGTKAQPFLRENLGVFGR